MRIDLQAMCGVTMVALGRDKPMSAPKVTLLKPPIPSYKLKSFFTLCALVA